MHIVILDAHVSDHGDVGWDAICALAPTTIYSHSPARSVAEQIGTADIVVSNSIYYDRALLASLPSLRCISLLSNGKDKVDVRYTTDHAIAVYSCLTYAIESTAEYVFALIFALARRVESHARMVSEGYWHDQDVFSCWHYPQRQLAGTRIGIIGYGAIGSRVADMARAFSMEVSVHSRNRSAVRAAELRWVSREELLRESDIVSLHCPLTPDTRGMIGAREFDIMKARAYLINTARGAVVNHAALRHALTHGHIAAAALDVLEHEPPPVHDALYTLDNCLITPHCAWAPVEARVRLIKECARNIAHFLAHTTQRPISL